MELFGSIDTTHLFFKISILLRRQSDPVWGSRCFFLIFFSLPRAVDETFLLFLAVLVVLLLLLLSQLFVGL